MASILPLVIFMLLQCLTIFITHSCGSEKYMDFILKRYKVLRGNFPFMQHFFLHVETLSKVMSLFFHTNCLSLGFSSPVPGREEAWLFRGRRLWSAGSLQLYKFPQVSWSYTSVYTSETRCPWMREFSLVHELLITFQKSLTALKVICTHIDSFLFFCYIFRIKVLESCPDQTITKTKGDHF